MWHNSKKHYVIKLTNWKCDKTKKNFKCGKTQEALNVIKLKNSKCDKTKKSKCDKTERNQIATKLISNKTHKLDLGEKNSKTPIAAKFRNSNWNVI